MSIDPKQPIPLYYQLKTLLVEEILDGRYAPAGGSRQSTSSASAIESVERRSAARSLSWQRKGSSCATGAEARSSTRIGYAADPISPRCESSSRKGRGGS